ncbi:MAG: thioredoxin domain-containing protein [bacterium]
MKHSNLTNRILSPHLVLLILIVSGALRIATAQSADRVVAVVNRKTITEQQLDDSLVAQLMPLEQQIYALRKTALEHLVVHTILEEEAKRRRLSVDELRQQLTSGVIKVAPSEVEAVYSENSAFFASMNPDEARQRLRLDLENQSRMKYYKAALAKLRETSDVKVLLEAPRYPRPLDDGVAPSLGSPEAAITIIEFSDFECPYCRSVQSSLKLVTHDFKNRVRLIFKHLPLDIHRQAFPAAQAAFCAGLQDRFWEYHDALFAAPNLSDEVIRQIATDLHLDINKFKTCLAAPESRAAVTRDLNTAKWLGLTATPSFLINGRLMSGALTFDEFKKVIDDELAVLKSNSVQK